MESTGEAITSTAGNVTSSVTDTAAVSANLNIELESSAMQTPVAALDSMQPEVRLGDQGFDEFVHSEKPAHDKLVDLSKMDESEEVADVKAEPKAQGPNENFGKKEPTFEQKIMMLQAEAIKRLAGRPGENKDKEAKELLKKLKKLIESMQGNGESVSSNVFSAVFSMFTILTKAGETGTNYMEEQSRKSNRKN